MLFIKPNTVFFVPPQISKFIATKSSYSLGGKRTCYANFELGSRNYCLLKANAKIF